MRAAVLVALAVSASGAASAGCGFAAPGAATSDDDDDSMMVTDAAPDARPLPDAPPAPWLDGYGRRRLVTAVAPGVNVDDVTILVTIDHDDDLASIHPTTAAAVAFAGPDGVLLPFEVERIAGGDLDAWVRVPHLGPTTTLYFYYDRTSTPVAPVPDPTTVWPRTTYDEVWHFTDVDAGSAPSSTGEHVAMTTTDGRNTPDRMDALYGQGREMTHTTTMAVDDGSTADHDAGSFSYSVLLHSNVMPDNEFDMPLYKGGSSAGQHGYDMELGNLAWNACIAGSVAGVACSSFSAEPPVDGYHYLTAVVDREAKQLRAYLDGVPLIPVALGDNFGSLSSSSALTIGRENYAYHGMLDELRVYTRALSSAEVAFEAQNLLAPGTAVTVSGTVEHVL